MKTYTPKASEIERQWYIVDAEGKTLGRLASQVATILRGKHKPTFATHMDTGDFVIVINAAKVKVTGNKERDKIYYRHSGYPGGFKQTRFADLIAKHPTRPVERAVRNMLPKNALGERMFKKLKVYAGPEHPHQAQRPTELRIEGWRRGEPGGSNCEHGTRRKPDERREAARLLRGRPAEDCCRAGPAVPGPRPHHGQQEGAARVLRRP